MKEREELISDLNDELFTYDKDFTNEDVYALFEKYVNNKAALRKVITFGMFHYEYVKYKMLFEGCLYEDGLSLIITQFRQAYQRNSKEFQRVTEKYVDDISRGYESQVQIAWLTDHKDKHERLDLFVKQAFIVIGDLIENAFKPFAFLLNELMNIGEGKDSKQTSLGGIVESLCEKNEILKALCKDLLMDISISQWRNISDHGSYECKGEDICVSYGNKNQYKKVISKKEIEYLLVMIDTILYMNKTAFALASLDYEDIFSSKNNKLENKPDLLKDNFLMQVAETSFAFGFKLINMCEADGVWNVFVESDKSKSRDEVTRYCTVVMSLIGSMRIEISRNSKVEYVAQYGESKKMFISKYLV